MIIPAILEENLKDIQNKIDLVSGEVERIQIDVCDGVFTTEETFLDLGKLRGTTSRIEYHLMVKNPLKFIDIPIKPSDSVIVHVESINVKESIKEFLKKTKRVGVCKNPDTSLNEIIKYIDLVNFVQFLTVHPGKQGQELLEKPYNEAIEFKEKYPTIPVQIDGGVNEENIKRIVQNKIYNLVTGSAVYKTTSPPTTIKKLNTRIKNLTKKVKVAFLGGSAFQPQDQTFKDSFEVAKILSKSGYVIVNGGGPGVMRASTLGASASGKYAQVITYHPSKPKTHYEGIDLDNTFDDEIVTLDYFDRTKVMLQTTDIHIVFKGSIGTLSEFGMTWVSSWIHEPNAKPIILYGAFWQEILDVFKKNLLILNNETDLFKICTTPEEVLEYVEKLEFHEKSNGNSKLI
jgi:ribulose-phosphate 3-epimerase